MIWHEAVRNDCKLFDIGGSQNLRTRDVHVSRVYERGFALIGTKGEEISVQADVRERRKMSWLLCDHDGEGAIVMPDRPAKPDTTSDGPVKGGHYV